jgi:hypothetical protein
MKKITTLLFLSIAFQSFAIDRFVDPNLSAGNGTTLFTNITSAITAAVNGDRIIVSSGTYNEAALTIGKSLQIMPQTPGTTINFNTNITIAGFPNMKLEITGFNFGINSLSSLVINSGSVMNRAKINIINCSFANIEFNNDYYELNLLNNILSGQLIFKYGNIVSNTMLNCQVLDEASNNIDITNKILIVNNNISNDLYVLNDNYRFILANNVLKNIYISKWIFDANISNRIINNQFSANSKIYFAILNGTAPYNGNINDYIAWNSSLTYNFKFSNNKFLGNILYGRRNTSLVFPNAFGCLFYGSSYDTVTQQATYSSTASDWPNINATGFFDWSYNGVTHILNSTGGLVYTNVSGPIDDINGGNPNHDYYDIDLTINDRGINGGPYSQLNYNASNPNNSKAFIFDLDMPADLFPGQNIEIKAKGYHKN